MDDATRIQIEAAAFRRLRDHLQARTDVQNIDLMNLAGFCRNCLGRWYAEEATALGEEMTEPQGRKAVYGMEYSDWKAKYQTGASPKKKAAFKTAFAENVGQPNKD